MMASIEHLENKVFCKAILHKIRCFIFTLSIFIFYASLSFADISTCEYKLSSLPDCKDTQSCHSPSIIQQIANPSTHKNNIQVNFEEDDSSTAKIIDAFNSFVALVNFIFVLYLFKVSRNDREADFTRIKKERREERAIEKRTRREERYIQTKAFWLQELIIQPNRDKILIFFQEILKLVDQYPQPSNSKTQFDRQIKQICRDFNIKKEDLSKTFVAELSVVDKALSQSLDQILDDLQDRFIDNISTNPLPTPLLEIKRDINSTKFNFFSEIYKRHCNL